MWRILKTINAFQGIKPTPNPYPISDGSYNLKLNPIQYNIFMENMKKLIKAHDVKQPEEAAPAEAPKPADSKPGAAKPDAAKPDAAKPDAAKPDAAKPDAAKPDATKPDAAKPDADKPADKPSDEISVTKDPST